MKKELIINLGYIGHCAVKLQKLFKGYNQKPNENGFFLSFENYSSLVINQGVIAHTNCFESEKDFQEMLYRKLIFNFSDGPTA
tara:strand:- start:133 stop:381 length:249 start_codon:yes stop_codon:yes gene_type:complete